MADSDFTIIQDVDYVSSPYVAPAFFTRVGNFVGSVVVGQDIETPNSILAFISGDRDDQVEYFGGLVGIVSFLSCLISIWFLTLLLLKCQGRDRMGCSAGWGFHDSESDDRSVVKARRRRGGASGTLFQGDGDDVSVGAAVDPDDSIAMDDPALRKSRSSSKHSKSSSMFGRKRSDPLNVGTKPKSYIHDSKNLNEIELHMELDNIVQSATRDSERKGKKNSQNNSWSLHSIPKAVNIGDESSTSDESNGVTKRQAIKKAWGETCLCSPLPDDVERRKFFTRAVFTFFSITSIMCCVFLVTHMYTPLESAALASAEVVKETAQIVDELSEVLDILDEATVDTGEFLDSIPLDYAELCPGFAIEDFQANFGFNPQTTIRTISFEYQTYIPTLRDSLISAKETGDAVTRVLVDINSAVSSTNEYLWIIPLVICVTILIIFSQLALMLAVAFKEQKFKDIQTTVPQVENCYGWTILPLQTIVVFVSWLLVIAFCFGIIITTDSCIPSISSAETGAINERGTPEDTVLAVLDQYMITTGTDPAVEALAKERLTTYVTGCGGMESDPLAEVIILQALLQESIKDVDTQVAFANDVTGLEFIENECGPGNRVRDFFTGLEEFNGKFSNIDQAIKQGYDALSCPRVNALYIEAVHGAFCTDFATANANGLVLLLVISFSGMILITLRASWRSAE